MSFGGQGTVEVVFVFSDWSGESSGGLENLGETWWKPAWLSVIIKFFIPWLSNPLIIWMFSYLDYHESVILQKTSLKGLILIIKSTYQGWYVSSVYREEVTVRHLQILLVRVTIGPQQSLLYRRLPHSTSTSLLSRLILKSLFRGSPPQPNPIKISICLTQGGSFMFDIADLSYRWVRVKIGSRIPCMVTH